MIASWKTAPSGFVAATRSAVVHCQTAQSQSSKWLQIKARSWTLKRPRCGYFFKCSEGEGVCVQALSLFFSVACSFIGRCVIAVWRGVVLLLLFCVCVCVWVQKYCSSACFAASRHLRRQITGGPRPIHLVLPPQCVVASLTPLPEFAPNFSVADSLTHTRMHTYLPPSLCLSVHLCLSLSLLCSLRRSPSKRHPTSQQQQQKEPLHSDQTAPQDGAKENAGLVIKVCVFTLPPLAPTCVFVFVVP